MIMIEGLEEDGSYVMKVEFENFAFMCLEIVESGRIVMISRNIVTIKTTSSTYNIERSSLSCDEIRLIRKLEKMQGIY